jgi:hypothetical protein
MVVGVPFGQAEGVAAEREQRAVAGLEMQVPPLQLAEVGHEAGGRFARAAGERLHPGQ